MSNYFIHKFEMIARNKEIIYLRFAENFFSENDILESKDCKLKVLKAPHLTKWKKFLIFISFKLYKPSPYYKCKIIY